MVVRSRFQVFLVPNYRAFRIPVKYVRYFSAASLYFNGCASCSCAHYCLWFFFNDGESFWCGFFFLPGRVVLVCVLYLVVHQASARGSLSLVAISCDSSVTGSRADARENLSLGVTPRVSSATGSRSGTRGKSSSGCYILRSFSDGESCWHEKKSPPPGTGFFLARMLSPCAYTFLWFFGDGETFWRERESFSGYLVFGENAVSVCV